MRNASSWSVRSVQSSAAWCARRQSSSVLQNVDAYAQRQHWVCVSSPSVSMLAVTGSSGYQAAATWRLSVGRAGCVAACLSATRSVCTLPAPVSWCQAQHTRLETSGQNHLAHSGNSVPDSFDTTQCRALSALSLLPNSKPQNR